MQGPTQTTLAAFVTILALSAPLNNQASADERRVRGHVEARLGEDAHIGVYVDSDPHRDRHYDGRPYGHTWHERIIRNFDRLDGSLRSIRRAHDGFEQLAYERPRSALPKIGLSLSNALLGNDRASIRNMRQAVRTDVTALRSAPISYSGRRAVKRVRRYFIYHSNQYPHDAQLWFMRAAIDVMLGYNDTARISIEHAMDYGANGPAADAVYRLLFRRHGHRGPRYGRGGPDYGPGPPGNRRRPPRDRRHGSRRDRHRR